jgi:formylglycine-generating enzyme required for sulfatase activity
MLVESATDRPGPGLARAPVSARALLLALSALLAGAGCPASGVAETQRTTSAAEPSAAVASAPSPDTSTTGPCAGMRAGARVCQGPSLLRCDDLSGAVTLLQTCLDIERCDVGRGECVPDCPPGEVYVPRTGPEGFTMGRGKELFGFGSRASGNPGKGVADTPHKVVLTRPFCIDAIEVTIGAYAKCAAELGCKPPNMWSRWSVYPHKTEIPVQLVHWRQAKYYCEAGGKSLPTEAQWEWAASGGSDHVYPWGDAPPTCAEADFTPGELTAPVCDCGCGGGGASPVGTHPKGDKVWPAGRIHDLAGNVWEWCLDNYVPYGADPETDPLHVTREDATHVVRGGGWNRSAAALTTSFRGAAVVDYQRPALGFRCVRNARGAR